MHVRTAAAFSLCAALSVFAQEPARPVATLAQDLGTTADWTPAAGERGPAASQRALRPGYKAELGACGFVLAPFRGAAAPRTLPFAWRGTAVRRGEVALSADAVAGVESEGRAAWISRGEWAERYELREDGVEQSWLFTRLPAGDGDLLIVGDVQTELFCAPRALEHASLAFLDEAGDPALTYGAALAIDARGRRLELATSWDGEHLEIRVDADWLAGAELPLLVDPLVSPVQVPAAFNGAPLRSTCLGLDGESMSARWLVGVVRSFSATDADVAAYLCDDGFANPRLVYLENSTASSDHTISACYIGSADRWVIAHQRDFTAAGGDFSAVRVYFHDRGNTVTGSGVATSIDGNPTHSYSAPDLADSGGNSSEISALLSFQIDATTTRANTNDSGVRCARIDAAARTVLAPVDLAVGRPAAGFDRERPALLPARFFNGEPWIAVWTERSTQAGSKARLVATHVSPLGVPRAAAELYAFPSSRHVVRPLVAGMLDYYYVAFGGTSDLQQNEANELFAMAVRWDDWQVAPVLLSSPRRVAGPLAAGGQLQPIELRDDQDTFSHAAITWLERTTTSGTLRTRARVARLGGTGGVTETAALFDVAGQDACSPSLLFHYAGHVFHAACGAAAAGAPVSVQRFEYPTDAVVTTTGNGCGNAYTQSPRPFAGDRYFALSVAGAPTNSPVLYWFSLAGAAIPLDVFSMPGCTLRVDPGANLLTIIPGLTNATGRCELPLPLPDAPVFLGDVWFQVVYLSPGANAQNLQLTAGGVIQVR